MTLTAWIHLARELGASDLHIETATPVAVRVRGELSMIDESSSAAAVERDVRALLGTQVWDQFVARVLPEDCQTFPFELIASAMRGDVSDQKAVLLVGAGENGKSTLLDAIISFLGGENVSGVPLQRLETDKFAAARLLGNGHPPSRLHPPRPRTWLRARRHPLIA